MKYKYVLISEYGNEIIYTDSDSKRERLLELGYRDYKEPDKKPDKEPDKEPDKKGSQKEK